jgi:hypothetical protein
MSHEIPVVTGCGEMRVKAGARRVTRSCVSCSGGSAGPPASAAAPRNPCPVPPHSGEGLRRESMDQITMETKKPNTKCRLYW